jgi:hypothetical protein
VTELRVQIRRTDGTTVWRAKRGALRSLILALSADLFARKMVIHRFGDDAAPLSSVRGICNPAVTSQSKAHRHHEKRLRP